MALAMWAALIVVAFAWGAVLLANGVLRLDAFPPLHGRLRFQSWQLLPAVVTGTALIVVMPRLIRLPWRPLLGLAWLASLAWTVALALSDGVSQLFAPFASRYEYLPVVPAIRRDPLAWLRHFTRDLPTYPTHVKGHPPLPDLILWALDRVGASGVGPGSALAIGLGTSAAAGVLITLRVLAGEDLARQAMPYLVLGPWVISVATSMDAIFLGVASWGTALTAVAATSSSLGMARVIPLVSAAAGGVLLGSLPYLSYGLVPFAAIPLALVLIARPRPYVVITTLAGAALVTALFAAAGFWWPDGLRATHLAWSLDAGALRPYSYFLIGNLAVLALLTGPATAVALPLVWRAAVPAPVRNLRSPQTAVALLALGALLAVLALDLSGFTRGEVQRIWIPFAIWIVPVASVLPAARTRTWLTAQVAVGLLLQATLQAPW